MYPFKILQIIPQPNDNITLELEDLNKNFPPYLAGQFLTLTFDFNGREVRRSYSFSSSPAVDEPLSITVKRVDNGEISRLLHHRTQVGDVLHVLAAQGKLVYKPQKDHAKILFLFAAGVGVTPLFSILKTALVGEDNTQVVLIYSNSAPEKTLFLEDLHRWQARFPDRLHVEWIFSNTKNLLNARLNREYILRLVQAHAKEAYTASFYLCGPVFYMDLCRFTLLGMGVSDADIHRETFHFPEEEADDDEKEADPVDTSSYGVTLRYQGQSYPLQVPYDQTILDVALAQKIKLPYSCKSGMCSTCIAQVSQGAVRMSYNEVLTDREVENGQCLICTAHPMEEGTVVDVR